MKLSKAQRETLAYIADGPRYVADHYTPRRKLIGMGLAWEGPKGLTITSLGRSALSDGDQT